MVSRRDLMEERAGLRDFFLRVAAFFFEVPDGLDALEAFDSGA